jgi:predicted nucleic acid-binding protein
MILCDTGPLVALLNRNDPQHTRCVEALRALPVQPLLTTLPCFGETIYLLGRVGGHAAQSRLWDMRRDGKLIVHLHSDPELSRMEELMLWYRDTPMDFADASLVVLAETTGLRQIFTLDRHFYAYRIWGQEVFAIVP